MGKTSDNSNTKPTGLKKNALAIENMIHTSAYRITSRLLKQNPNPMYKTSEDHVLQQMLMLILLKELPTNDFLSQPSLAKLLNVSRSTIRNCLHKLESSGYIESIPHRGFYIPAQTEDVIRDRYFLREILETAAVRRIIENGCKSQYEQILREKANRCGQIPSPRRNVVTVKHQDREDKETRQLSDQYEDSFWNLVECHFDFHHTLAECSESALLVESLDRHNFFSIMVNNALCGWGGGDRPLQLPEVTHEELVDAIFTGELSRGEEAIILHLKGGLSAELDHLSDF
jgi:DNA-binding GntR family transcriptional regulator